jgi:NADPH2:quinone reductase
MALPALVLDTRDLPLRINAISVYPVDAKVCKNTAPAEGQVKVPCCDAVGVVEAVGASVALCKPGQGLYQAGDINRGRRPGGRTLPPYP